MTIDEIADFCEFTDCRVSVGSPETGFIEIDGTGVTSKFNAYRRFLAHRELAALADPKRVVDDATSFKVHDEETRDLSREDFEKELRRFQRLVS